MLVCFGTHAIGDCPLDAPPLDEHGILFETNGHPAADSFITRFFRIGQSQSTDPSEFEDDHPKRCSRTKLSRP